MSVTAITSLAQFNKVINGEKPVVIDFWATWCGPCAAMSPIFEQFPAIPIYEEKVAFYKVDIEEQEEIAREVAIQAIPTFMVFSKGGKVGEVLGANPGALEALIQKVIDM